MHPDRRSLYEQLEQNRGSKVLVYITGDRKGLETKIGHDVYDFFVDHLDRLWHGANPESSKRISLYLYTRGGETLAAWGLANLLRQFCDHLEIIIPSKAYSSGTLISLAANSILMTKQARLGPIDPSVQGPLNPQIPGSALAATAPVSVEDLSAFLEFTRSAFGEGNPADVAAIVLNLTQHIHPLVLGNSYRTRGQIRMLGEKLLSYHIQEETEVAALLDFLCGESGSHDYPINRREARDNLGLPVEKPDDVLYKIIKEIYDDLATELELTAPFDPDVVLGGAQEAPYCFRRALIESLNGGSHVFITEGVLRKQQVQDRSGLTQVAITDIRSRESWQHEHHEQQSDAKAGDPHCPNGS